MILYFAVRFPGAVEAQSEKVHAKETAPLHDNKEDSCAALSSKIVEYTG